MFEKFGGGWLAFVFAAAVIVTGYTVLEWARRYPLGRKLLHPIEILGLKGLPGYMAMVLTILIIASMPQIPRNDAVVVFVIIVSGFAEWGAYRFDRLAPLAEPGPGRRGRCRCQRRRRRWPHRWPLPWPRWRSTSGATASIITPAVSTPTTIAPHLGAPAPGGAGSA